MAWLPGEASGVELSATIKESNVILSSHGVRTQSVLALKINEGRSSYGRGSSVLSRPIEDVGQDHPGDPGECREPDPP